MTNTPREVVRSDLVRACENIFIKVNSWGKFETSDIQRNGIYDYEEQCVDLLDFAANFERKLDRKAGLPHAALTADKYDCGSQAAHFELFEDESHKAKRCAEPLEVIHISFIASFNWQNTWQVSRRRAFKADIANTMFFHPLICDPNYVTAKALVNRDWPVQLVVKCEALQRLNQQLRKYRPRSDSLITNSTLPRLLVEINSTPSNRNPPDLTRMLLGGSAIVRFANTLKAFCQTKNFVLCAVFIWDHGFATRNTLFQHQNSDLVYCKDEEISLNAPVGRVRFARNLYNLLHVNVDDEECEDTRNATKELNTAILKQPNMKSFFTEKDDEESNKSDDERHNKKCARTGDGGGAEGRRGGTADDHAELRTHGYEVKQEVTVDAGGVALEPLFEIPSHIFTVYRPLDPKKELVAKKVRQKSNELEILELLNTTQPKSDHFISLLDSFHGRSRQWAILPKLDSVADYVSIAPNQLESKVVQICLGLIKGLAHLHELFSAHRDIKPDNLFVDQDFCVKIIDFDIALQVKDEDEEVDDQCGTKRWTAPEVEKKIMYSPIKADRWSCGRVLLYLLDEFRKEEKHLKAIARSLTAHNPKQRPSLLRWRSYLLPPNIDERKASRPRQDSMEIDGENTKPPDPKRQSPSLGQSMLEVAGH